MSLHISELEGNRHKTDKRLPSSINGGGRCRSCFRDAREETVPKRQMLCVEGHQPGSSPTWESQ